MITTNGEKSVRMKGAGKQEAVAYGACDAGKTPQIHRKENYS